MDGAIICPDVHIGNRCIIGAGNIVIKDIPDNSIAVGNPATIKRKTSLPPNLRFPLTNKFQKNAGKIWSIKKKPYLCIDLEK